MKNVTPKKTPKTVSTELVIAPEEELGMIANHVTQLNMAAQNFAAQAVYCAVLAGAKLNRAKTILPHGEFSKWAGTNFPTINIRSCQRWMALADSLEQRLIGKNDTVSHLGESPLLALPDPRDLQDSSNKEIVRQVNEVIDGRGLTELYRDLGVVKARENKSKERVKRIRQAETDAPSRYHALAQVWLDEFKALAAAITDHADYLDDDMCRQTREAVGTVLCAIDLDPEEVREWLQLNEASTED